MANPEMMQTNGIRMIKSVSEATFLVWVELDMFALVIVFNNQCWVPGKTGTE